nr:hypothetical protein [Tanacetum cinerariifolium]
MLDDTSTRYTARNSMAHVNVASTDQNKKDELLSKGIKSPYKLLSPKYLSQASLEEQNRNPSSLIRVHFINYAIFLCKENEVREVENVKPNATKYNDHEMTAKVEEKVEEESEDWFEEEEGTIAFREDNERLTFKMPHKMEMSKNVDFTRVSIERIPSIVIGGNDDGNEKTHYLDSLNLGPEYKYDESVCKAIRSLMRMKNTRKNKGEVT